MPERLPEDFVRSAERRLRNASNVYVMASGQPYDEVFLEMADVAMLVWSAGIDTLSALMLLSGEPGLSTSSQRRRYVRQRLAPTYPHMRLLFLWTNLARLHNFQHNLDMPQSQFELDCRQSGRMIAELNGLLPAALRLRPDAYAWLGEVG